jgi:hypothetical protein
MLLMLLLGLPYRALQIDISLHYRDPELGDLAWRLMLDI